MAPTATPPMMSHPRAVILDASWATGNCSDLCLEDVLDGFCRLRAHLRGELHRHLGVLDGDDGALGVLDGARRQCLGGGVGALLALLERGDRTGELAPEARGTARRGTTAGGGALGDPGDPFDRESAADRRDDHLSSPSVAVNMDLAVCIAVTSDW